MAPRAPKDSENLYSLFHSDGLVIQTDEFNYPLCNLFDLVAVWRKFLSPSESILQCACVCVCVASVQPLPELRSVYSVDRVFI